MSISEVEGLPEVCWIDSRKGFQVQCLGLGVALLRGWDRNDSPCQLLEIDGNLSVSCFGRHYSLLQVGYNGLYIGYRDNPNIYPVTISQIPI